MALTPKKMTYPRNAQSLRNGKAKNPLFGNINPTQIQQGVAVVPVVNKPMTSADLFRQASELATKPMPSDYFDINVPTSSGDGMSMDSGLSPADKMKLYNAVLAENSISPYSLELTKVEAEKAAAASRAEWLKTNPSPDVASNKYDVQYPEAVVRESAVLPNREGPKYNPWVGGLAAIAGLLVPEYAGQINAAPLQAGIEVANRNYEDRVNQYRMKTAELSQKYEDALGLRNEAIARAREQKSDLLKSDLARWTEAKGIADAELDRDNADGAIRIYRELADKDLKSAGAKASLQSVLDEVTQGRAKNDANARLALGQQQQAQNLFSLGVQMKSSEESNAARKYAVDQTQKGKAEDRKLRYDLGKMANDTKLAAQAQRMNLGWAKLSQGSTATAKDTPAIKTLRKDAEYNFKGAETRRKVIMDAIKGDPAYIAADYQTKMKMQTAAFTSDPELVKAYNRAIDIDKQLKRASVAPVVPTGKKDIPTTRRSPKGNTFRIIN